MRTGAIERPPRVGKGGKQRIRREDRAGMGGKGEGRKEPPSLSVESSSGENAGRSIVKEAIDKKKPQKKGKGEKCWRGPEVWWDKETGSTKPQSNKREGAGEASTNKAAILTFVTTGALPRLKEARGGPGRKGRGRKGRDPGYKERDSFSKVHQLDSM